MTHGNMNFEKTEKSPDRWTLGWVCLNQNCHRGFHSPRYGKCPFCRSKKIKRVTNKTA